MANSELTWQLDKEDPMTICIYKNAEDYKSNTPMMRIFLGEAIESAGRVAVMKHIQEIERTPWIRPWHSHVTFNTIKNST